MIFTPTISGESLSEKNDGLADVFRLLQEREGIDLTAYRRKTIERRVISRLQKLRCQDFKDYAIRLAGDPEESRRLLEHVTIKVSHFFRDAPVFERLREVVLADLVRGALPEKQIQIWSAGCGNGEEPYSLSILLHEIARRETPVPTITVWGTDIDKGALAAARRGLYSESALLETPPELAEAYFARQKGRFGPQYELSASGREKVGFLNHDLLSSSESPLGLSFDLVLCRNVLIYFERAAQERVVRLLASSVAVGGYLCLGQAEQLSKACQAEFETVDRQARLYRKAK